ncbi:hypothetical protein [Pseudomonas fluorescens]|uniref:hypothetical protein n=1 Tax=Pseudomonas fluorescens TaxID=294 RepID=UPI00124140C6|nr:hypothetical protein [Pseudomonas fluorescens]
MKFYIYNFMKKYRLNFTVATFQPEKGYLPFRETPVTVGASLLAMDSSAPRSARWNALSLTSIASKLAPTGYAVRPPDYAVTVGASLLAMESSAPRLTRSNALSLTIIASKLAPTGPVMR